MLALGWSYVVVHAALLRTVGKAALEELRAVLLTPPAEMVPVESRRVPATRRDRLRS